MGTEMDIEGGFLGMLADTARKQAQKKAALRKVVKPSDVVEAIKSWPKPKVFGVGDIVVLERKIPGVRWVVGEPFVVAITEIGDRPNVFASPDRGENLSVDDLFGDVVVARPRAVDRENGDVGYTLFLSASGYFRAANGAEIARFESGEYAEADRQQFDARDDDEGSEPHEAVLNAVSAVDAAAAAVSAANSASDVAKDALAAASAATSAADAAIVGIATSGAKA